MTWWHHPKLSWWQALGRRVHLFFLPHEENDFVPHAAQHRALFSYSLFLIALKVASFLLVIFLPASTILSSAITSSNILELTNTTRVANGLAPLVANTRLANAATAKASDMLSGQYFAHTSPEGATPWTWIRGAGYDYTVAGENLAVHYTEAEDVQSAWLASPSHRANILDPRFKEVGIGIVRGTFEDFDTTFVVQMFGTPTTPLSSETPPPASEPPSLDQEPVPELTPPEHTEINEEEPFLAEQEVAGEVTEIEPETEVFVESFVLTPEKTSEAFTVTMTASLVEEANLLYNGSSTPLKKTEGTDTFTGTLTIPETAYEDTLVVASLVTEEGTSVIEPVGVLNPDTGTAGVYAFSAPKTLKLFNYFNVPLLENTIALIYAGAVIFLLTILLLTVLIRFEHQRHSTTAHLAVVILLAFALLAL